MLAALDVIWIHDGFIRPPGPKMVVCLEPRLGLFFRINSEPKWQTPVLLTVADHPFLKWDSHLECGEPLELDDYMIEESVRHRGIIGRVKPELAAVIYGAIVAAKTVSDNDKAAIKVALGL